MLTLGKHIQDPLKDHLHISPHADIGTHILSDLRPVDIDMDRHAFTGIFIQVAGGPVRKPHAHSKQQIALGLGHDGGVLSVHAAHAQVQRIRGRH